MQTLITDLSDKECRPTEIVVLTSCSASRRRESRAINSVPITIAGSLKAGKLQQPAPDKIIWRNDHMEWLVLHLCKAAVQ